MKFKKLLIIFFSLLLGCTLIINYFSQNSDELDRFAIIDIDVNDMNKKEIDTFITESEYFELLTSIQIKNDNNNDGIEFLVQMDNPSTFLKNVKITVLLNENLENIFYTDQFFF